MSRYEELWKIALTLIVVLFLFVAVFSTAISSHLIVYDVNKTDLRAIVLGASAVILTGVAVVLGVAALWGYREIREALVQVATASAREAATTVATQVTADLVPRLVEARIGPDESKGPGAADLGSAFPRNSDAQQ